MKVRIKEVTASDGSTIYYIQYRRFGIWFYYKEYSSHPLDFDKYKVEKTTIASCCAWLKQQEIKKEKDIVRYFKVGDVCDS